MNPVNRQILLVSRPSGEPSVDNFRLERVPVPALAATLKLAKGAWLAGGGVGAGAGGAAVVPPPSLPPGPSRT